MVLAERWQLQVALGAQWAGTSAGELKNGEFSAGQVTVVGQVMAGRWRQRRKGVNRGEIEEGRRQKVRLRC